MYAGWDPERRTMATELIRRLGGRRAVESQVVRFSIVEDKCRDGLYRTAKRAWFDHIKARGATHHLVLQEDMTPCKGFIASAKEALEAAPDQIVCFWYGDKRVEDIKPNGPAWVLDTVSHGGSTVVPVEMIFPWWKWTDTFLAWRKRHKKKDFYCEDALRDLWGLTRGLKVWHPLPSLLQHGVEGVELNGDLDHGSILGHKYRPSRHSRWYIGNTPRETPDWKAALENTIEHNRSPGVVTMARSLPEPVRERLGLAGI
jgi:hypothetical protein